MNQLQAHHPLNVLTPYISIPDFIKREDDNVQRVSIAFDRVELWIDQEKEYQEYPVVITVNGRSDDGQENSIQLIPYMQKAYIDPSTTEETCAFPIDIDEHGNPAAWVGFFLKRLADYYAGAAIGSQFNITSCDISYAVEVSKDDVTDHVVYTTRFMRPTMHWEDGVEAAKELRTPRLSKQALIVDTSTRARLWNFPAGEVGVEVSWAKGNYQVYVIRLYNAHSDGIVAALMLADAARRSGYEKVALCLPYMPYGRQDRPTAPGTAYSLWVFANILSVGKFDQIFTLDPHSSKTDRHIPNLHTPSLHALYSRITDKHISRKDGPYIIVAPDEGAMSRARTCSTAMKNSGYDITDVVYAKKVRDPATGQVTSIQLSGAELEPTDRVIVVDDICDGGRTFIELAKALGKVAHKTLFVTHGLFSKGIDVVAEHYDRIITTDSVDVEGISKDDIISIQPLIDDWMRVFSV